MTISLRAAAIFLAASVHVWSAERVIAGFGQVTPLHYEDAHGAATGLVVDAINEAARREKIVVVWTSIAGSREIESALTQGRIDIFPAGIITDDRRARFWVSEPWWTEDLSILVRADLNLAQGSNWEGRRVILPSQAYLSIASRLAPRADFQVRNHPQGNTNPSVDVSILCNRDADAVLMSHSTLDDFLMNRPAACSNIDFRILETTDFLPLSVIARWQSRAAAERLYGRIAEMARDGTLMAIAGRYPRTSARSAAMLGETTRLRYRERSLSIALAGIFGVVIVVTLMLLRQLRIQRALRSAMAAQANMERMLRVRTQELTVSNEELQAFAYSISHDLQEPLRTISLFAQWLEIGGEFSSAETLSKVAIIRNSAIRMLNTLQQLLRLSRAGQSDTPRVSVPIQSVLDDVLRDFNPQIQSTSAEVIIGFMPTVEGWPDRLSILFQNLIGNALKYRRENVAPRITIRSTDHETDWQVSVSDNGIGFEPKYADQIFKVFKRLHVEDEYGGAGVGLAIVKKVVERHGGRIWAEGKPGEGSAFHFTFPKQFPTATIADQRRETSEFSTSMLQAK